MLNNFIKAIKHPEKIIPYVILRINQLQVFEILVDGALFHRYKGKRYPDYLNHGNACKFIAQKALTYCKGMGIDIGADKWPLPGAIPIHDEPQRNAYKLDSFADNSLDYVFSSHCLEHLDNWHEALSLWISKLKIGGVLFLYLPHKAMKLWNPGAPWVGNAHKWKPQHEILVPFLSERAMEIIEYNPSIDKYWSFHIVAKRVL